MTENYISQDSKTRKRMPMASGLLDYFPAALAAVAEHSFIGNEKHNPGQPLHWSRGNSPDHADCIVRHVIDRGTHECVMYNGQEYNVRHSAALAWRALALLQEELEAEGMTPGRSSHFPEEPIVNEFGMTAKEQLADDGFLRGHKWSDDELERARGQKPLNLNRVPEYDVRVVADKASDRETADVLEGLINYWRHDPVPSFELTPKGKAFIKGEEYGETWAGLVAAKRGAEAVAAMKARKKKRAVPKPARKRK